MNRPVSIPRPMVRTNQWVILLSVLVVWVTGWFGVLVLPLASGLLGIATGFHPILRMARMFLRKPPAAYAQEDAEQQRFNQWIAIGCLAVALLGYAVGWRDLADVFSAMVALASLVAILGFCVGCFLRFQWHQYQYRRATRRSA